MFSGIAQQFAVAMGTMLAAYWLLKREDKPLSSAEERARRAEILLGERVGVSQLQGHRDHMEDRVAVLPARDENDWTLFGVFDGHAGSVSDSYGDRF